VQADGIQANGIQADGGRAGYGWRWRRGYCQTLPKKVNGQFAKTFTKSGTWEDSLEKANILAIFLLTNAKRLVFRVDRATSKFVLSRKEPISSAKFLRREFRSLKDVKVSNRSCP
jgi:hypothetical protein